MDHQNQRLNHPRNQLKQQIVVRARNFMPEGQDGKDKFAECFGVFKQDSLSNFQEVRGMQTKQSTLTIIESLKKECEQRIEKLWSSLQKLDDAPSSLNFLSRIRSSWVGYAKVLNAGFFELAKAFITMSLHSSSSSMRLEITSQFVEEIKKCWASVNGMLLDLVMVEKQEDQQPIRIKQRQRCLQESGRNVRQLQDRCQLIIKALNQSEQANYQLRLQVQDCQIKMRASNVVIEAQAASVEELNIKIEQLEVMKKQYLRAYSRVKEEKQSLSLKLLDLELEAEHGGKSEGLNTKSDDHIDQARLNTIVQHNQQEADDEFKIKDSSHNSEASQEPLLKYTQQLVDKIGGKVFEIICNLPFQDHHQFLFAPANQEELDDALSHIHQFFVNFDKHQERISSQSQKLGRVFVKIIQQICIAKNVSADMLIEIVECHFGGDSQCKMLFNSLIKMLANHNILGGKEEATSSSRHF